jgi:hypothetical protein
MSRNGSGVYSLPAGNPVVTGTTISSTWANTTLNDIATALTGSVSADGQTPITGPLNLNSNEIINLPAGTVAGNAVEFAQFSTPTFTGIATFQADGIFTGTGEVQLPSGTTAQRTATPVTGMIRYNSTIGAYEGYKSGIAGVSIASIFYVTTTATLTTTSAHGLSTGSIVVVSGATPSAYNGTFTVTVTGATTFTYVMGSNPVANASVVGSYTYGAWTSIGGGATGGGTDNIFNLNGQVITTSYTIPSGYNANTTGTVTINSGVVVTVSTGSRWVIV